MTLKQRKKELTKLLTKIGNDKESRYSKNAKKLLEEDNELANKAKSKKEFIKIAAEIFLRLLQIGIKVFDP